MIIIFYLLCPFLLTRSSNDNNRGKSGDAPIEQQQQSPRDGVGKVRRMDTDGGEFAKIKKISIYTDAWHFQAVCSRISTNLPLTDLHRNTLQHTSAGCFDDACPSRKCCSGPRYNSQVLGLVVQRCAYLSHTSLSVCRIRSTSH